MTDRAAPGRERRSHRRRPLGAPTWIVVGGARVSVNAVNVSVGGAAVHTGAKAEVGEVVRLEVGIFGNPTVHLDAEVVRAEHGVLALRFLALGQRALEALLDASGVSPDAESREDDPSGVRHVGPEEVPGSRRGA
jgi:hypothetical protein